MISKEMANMLANEWINSWNSHDLDRILNHYSDDVEFTTPFIALLMNEPTGTFTGKQNVRKYWAKAFERAPDLNFKLLDVTFCVNSITIYYRAVFGLLAMEVHFYNDVGKIEKAVAHYNDIKIE